MKQRNDVERVNLVETPIGGYQPHTVARSPPFAKRFGRCPVVAQTEKERGRDRL